MAVVPDAITGDAVPSWTRTGRPIYIGFTPRASVRTQSDAGASDSETRWLAVVPVDHPFRIGDRMGPADSQTPSFEVVSCLDYPGCQNLEVKLI